MHVTKIARKPLRLANLELSGIIIAFRTKKKPLCQLLAF